MMSTEVLKPALNSPTEKPKANSAKNLGTAA
jgi:hypothetical protein